MNITQKLDSAVAKKSAESEEETLIPVIMDGPSAVHYQSRIPYDFNYYGDFYFASMSDRSKRLRDTRCAKIGTELDKSEEPDKNVGGYQKYDVLDLEVCIAYLVPKPGPLRFKDLPVEVRKIIFQLIASVIFHFYARI
ncbi:hypothetical protein BOTCAL_0055g00120 [Botryotinia calthae]|uniref:Uncharacterized protein n=1 Tax=Botryotinia calthae TaxID=38488 RepID=A0A4Y8DAV7_9HELO|nr:hypothetical protein BOTCAL_0055g00120 [Botryotinia calthae]